MQPIVYEMPALEKRHIKGQQDFHRLTLAVALASSDVLRPLSRPARGIAASRQPRSGAEKPRPWFLGWLTR
jgi:hypothetical protein